MQPQLPTDLGKKRGSVFPFYYWRLAPWTKSVSGKEVRNELPPLKESGIVSKVAKIVSALHKLRKQREMWMQFANLVAMKCSGSYIFERLSRQANIGSDHNSVSISHLQRDRDKFSKKRYIPVTIENKNVDALKPGLAKRGQFPSSGRLVLPLFPPCSFLG